MHAFLRLLKVSHYTTGLPGPLRTERSTPGGDGD